MKLSRPAWSIRSSPKPPVLSEAKAIARKLAAGPTIAFGEMKRLFLNVSSRQAAAQMEEEAQALARVSLKPTTLGKAFEHSAKNALRSLPEAEFKHF